MSDISRLQRARTALAVIDMQEAFRPIIGDFDVVASRIALAVRGARLLGVPLVVTEQYPRGLKRTAREILEALDPTSRSIEKQCFSACGAAEFVASLARSDVKQVLLCGIEAHICVTQTALDLLAREFEVHLLTDCITSRIPDNKTVALQRLTLAGAVPSSLEMCLFELMRTADASEFKAIQALIK